jgi:hypothetical protein
MPPRLRIEVSPQHLADSAETIKILQEFQPQAQLQQVRQRLKIASGIEEHAGDGLAGLGVPGQPSAAQVTLGRIQRPAPRIPHRLRARAAPQLASQVLPHVQPGRFHSFQTA